MIGKILTISDADGQAYVDDAREAWRSHGFLLVDMSIETVLVTRDFDDYQLIAITMSQSHSALYLKNTKTLRSMTNIPIVIFPIEDAKIQAIFSVREGADQVIALPADMEWAIANCLALIRRFPASNTAPPLTLYVDYKLFLNVGRYSVNVDGREIELHKKEFDVLRYLMEHRGYVCTYSQIYTTVWGFDYHDSSNELLWSQIKNLRRRLQWKPELPEYIKTKRGVGYSFSPFFKK